jgi:hypothetical protein
MISCNELINVTKNVMGPAKKRFIAKAPTIVAFIALSAVSDEAAKFLWKSLSASYL